MTPEQLEANRAAKRRYARSARGKAAQKAWREANRDKMNAASRKYYSKNKAAHAKRVKDWAAKNPERVAELRRESSKRNPHSNRRRRHERRARERGVKVEHVDPAVVLQRSDGICGICGGQLDPENFHVDHITPIARGGDHSYANTQAAHPFCNQSKHDREDC